MNSKSSNYLKFAHNSFTSCCFPSVLLDLVSEWASLGVSCHRVTIWIKGSLANFLLLLIYKLRIISRLSCLIGLSWKEMQLNIYNNFISKMPYKYACYSVTDLHTYKKKKRKEYWLYVMNIFHSRFSAIHMNVNLLFKINDFNFLFSLCCCISKFPDCIFILIGKKDTIHFSV